MFCTHETCLMKNIYGRCNVYQKLKPSLNMAFARSCKPRYKFMTMAHILLALLNNQPY
ncbi:MAG: hypothetical protein IGNPGNKH_00851 [Sodalis sp. Ffu]|nr:MAG: hypothetical protein IGNPGNKH_00851 [Sodalis sp. Ffu]